MQEKTMTTLELAAEIISAFLSNNHIEAENLPGLIKSVFSSLEDAGKPKEEPIPELVPAVPIKKSVFQDYIICLEDGKKLKMLKRHLKTAYNMTPEQYREKWGLPSNYPLVAPSYAEKRSELAKQIGLGNSVKKQKSEEDLEVKKIPESRRGRKPKAEI